MKPFIIIFTFLLSICLTVHAQTFEESLSDALVKFERTDTLQRKLASVNRIDLIKNKWSDRWEAYYYGAYTKLVVSYLLSDEKQRDGLIDQAETEIDKVKAFHKLPDDELSVMDAYVANARIAVKAGSRWRKYGSIFDAKLEEAKKVNANNPRIYFLKGQSLFYTPKAFGGGAKKALPYFEKAATHFAGESKEGLDKPHWGNSRNEYFILECKRDN